MSKTKKIATAAVSIVLAASTCFAFTACDDQETGGTDFDTVTPSGPTNGLTASQDILSFSVDEEGNLAWSDDLSLNMNMGQSDSVHLAFETSNIPGGTTATLLDGKDYTSGSLKPAWQSLSDKLGITIVDSYNDEGSSSSRVDNLISATRLGEYAMVSGTATQIVNAGSGSNAFLDLSLYLDYMPNFKAFLEENPVVYMSLTSQTDTGAIYYAPYFDGNDDIEKYEIANVHWIKALLDSDDNAGSTTETYAGQATAKVELNSSATSGDVTTIDGTKSYIESFMGTTGSWWVESSNPDDEGATTVTVTVSYDDALAAAKQSGSALNTALTAAGVTTSSLTSGNIVDLQNAAINATNGNVTGQQLLNILKAYIDVTYSVEGEAYDTRSDVFADYDAAWDVDLLVGLMRCLVTNTSLLPDTNLQGAYGLVYGLMGRQNNLQRESDIMSLAGELYGVRGFTSRYEYTYIDSDGVIQDARLDADSYDAMEKMHMMAVEGLLYTGDSQSAGNTSFYTSSTTPVSMMIYDYVQTQTANGGFAAQGITSNSNVPEGYDFTPINTPVSKWDDGDTSTTANTDGITYSYDGDYKYMRFTESWRSVKNTGFGIPYAYVQNNPERLSACLAVLDYMFSNDGQILMTYGEVSSNDNISGNTTDGFTTTTDGWWYAEDVTDEVELTTVAEQVEGSDQYTVKDDYAADYFIYENRVYANGTYYKGEMQPTMTTASLMLFYGYEVNGLKFNDTDANGNANNPIGAISVNRSYTNYARNIIGSAQPMGNKLQSFEYQCTAECGLDGADMVAAGLVNGTISHVYTDPDNAKGIWYFIVPTTLPYDANTATYISDTFAAITDDIFSRESGATINFYWDIIVYGYGDDTGLSDTAFVYGDVDLGQPADAAAAIASVTRSDLGGTTTSGGMAAYEALMQNAFEQILDFYEEYVG